MMKRIRIQVKGRVQGVGFRPTVWRYAHEFGLSGFVSNTTGGVRIEVQGAPDRVEAFVLRLQSDPPPRATVDTFAVEALALLSVGPDADPVFEIRTSQRSGDLEVGLPPDMATCPDCVAELLDPRNRRYRYPFINCVNCGPRYTIIHELPYDRERTAMASFRMCPDCAAEFGNPVDRRFEAQPTACPVCGPALTCLHSDVASPLEETVRLLREGRIVALKGVGGYHLCCSAVNDDAIKTLRQRKDRPAKALAVMFAALEQIREWCDVTAEEERELTSPAAPIVVVRLKGRKGLSPLLSPDTRDLGVFLPYTPLHHLLLRDISPLVMTSGNRAEEPIAADETEVAGLLGPIADAVLAHNRPIVQRCDDSVIKLAEGGRLMIRRARGFVPDPIAIPMAGPSGVACGALLKNTVGVTRGNKVFLSSHIGDLEDLKTHQYFERSIRDLERLLGVTPEWVAHDLHPDYLSTRYAVGRAGLRHFPVQHHHAHLAACLAEHGVNHLVMGVALDGSGYGPDGTIWGGECLVVGDLASYRRVGCFQPCPLPGGESAIRWPWRMALSLLHQEDLDHERVLQRLWPDLDPTEREPVQELLGHPRLSPLTSSAGRLFDAVSALLGFQGRVSYEGQAAIRLQTLADQSGVGDPCEPYAWECRDVRGFWQLSFGVMIRRMVEDVLLGQDRGVIAARFHQTLALAVAEWCVRIRGQERLNEVALSGGVFQNDRLLGLLVRNLKARGFTVYTPHQAPPNDGCIALGQAAVALARIRGQGKGGEA